MARPRRQPRVTQPSRASAGLRSLRVDSTPTSVARWRSRDMIERDYFSHDIPGCGRLQAPRSRRATATCWPARTSAGTRTRRRRHGRDPRHVHGLVRPSAQHPRAALGGDRRRRVQGVDGKKMWTVLFADRCGPTAKAAPGPPREPPRLPPDDAEAHAQADSQAHAVPDAGADAGADREPDAGSAHPADSDARAPSGRGAGARRTSGDDGDGTAGRVVVRAACSRRSWAASPVSSSAHDDRGGY